MNDPPVTVLRTIVPAALGASTIEAGMALNMRVGGGVTVKVYVAVCVPVLSVAVRAMAFAPGAMPVELVTVTVAFAPGRTEAGVILPTIPLGAVAAKDTGFLTLPLSFTANVNVMVFPAAAVPLVAEGVSEKSTLGFVVVDPAIHALTSSLHQPSPAR